MTDSPGEVVTLAVTRMLNEKKNEKWAIILRTYMDN